MDTCREVKKEPPSNLLLQSKCESSTKKVFPGKFKETQNTEAYPTRHGSQCEDIPIVIGGKEYRTDNVQYQVCTLLKTIREVFLTQPNQVMPHDHQKKVAKFYWATPELVQLSIDTALAAKKD